MRRNLQTPLALAILLALAAPAWALEGTLKAVKARNAFVIGYLKDAKPMSFEGPNGADGYSVELCRRIAAEAGKAVGIEKLEIRYVPLTVQTRMDAVISGKVDIDCGTTTATLSRMQKVDFTILTFIDGGSLAVKKGSAIRNVGGLAGQSVAVLPGTTTEKALREALGEKSLDAKLVQVSNHAAGIAAVQGGKVAAYAADRTVLVTMLSQPTNAQLDLATQFTVEPYGFMVRRGDPDFRLVANRALSRTYRSGDIYTIVERWFGAGARPGDALLLMYQLTSLPE
jgi:ABC-type amino acid transport substrate-binding protein